MQCDTCLWNIFIPNFLESKLLFYLKDDEHEEGGISVSGSGRPLTVKSEWYDSFFPGAMAPLHSIDFASFLSYARLFMLDVRIFNLHVQK